MAKPRNFLFICKGNDARSQMAEGFARALATGEPEMDGSVGESLRVYPTRRADGTLAIVVLNLGADESALSLSIAGIGNSAGATLTTARTDDLEATELIEEGPLELAVADGGTMLMDLSPWSINLVESPMWFDMFFGKVFGDIKVTPLAYYVGDPSRQLCQCPRSQALHRGLPRGMER